MVGLVPSRRRHWRYASKDIKTLDYLFVHTLRDIYYAENAITKALPKVIAAAGNADLKTALQNHLVETETVDTSH